MSRLIIDMGSGNTCKNDTAIVKQMIDEIGKFEWQSTVTLKWQLFQTAPPNMPLERKVFNYAYKYAREEYGLGTTASVFDYPSLLFLLNFKPSFVKLANHSKLYKLIDDIPFDIPIFRSISAISDSLYDGYSANRLIVDLMCVSKYPASPEDYEAKFNLDELKFLSDHTKGTEFAEKVKPIYIEKHFKLDDSVGLDAGDFAATIEELQVIDSVLGG